MPGIPRGNTVAAAPVPAFHSEAALDRQLLTALETTVPEHSTAASRTHTSAEAVNALATSLLWLPCAFWHQELLENIRISTESRWTIIDQDDALLYPVCRKTANCTARNSQTQVGRSSVAKSPVV